MSPSRRPKKADLAALRLRLEEKFLRTERWGGLSSGDLVRVRGERGARFVFRCHVVNRANGARWVELDELASGGHQAPEHEGRVVRRQRAVSEEQVVPLRRRPSRPAPQGFQMRFALDDPASSVPS